MANVTGALNEYGPIKRVILRHAREAYQGQDVLDAMWRPQEFKLARTVRHEVRRQVYVDLREVSVRMADRVEDHVVRENLGQRDARVESDREFAKAIEVLESGDPHEVISSGC